MSGDYYERTDWRSAIEVIPSPRLAVIEDINAKAGALRDSASASRRSPDVSSRALIGADPVGKPQPCAVYPCRAAAASSR